MRRLRARLAASSRGELDPAAAARLRCEIARYSHSTVCDKRELFWQRHPMSFKLPAIARVAAGALRG